MALTICVACGHPAPEHGPFGCSEAVDDDDPALCACERTEADVYRQHVPPPDPAGPPAGASETNKKAR